MEVKESAKEIFENISIEYGYEIGVNNTIIKLDEKNLNIDEFHRSAILLKEYNDLCLKMKNVFDFSQEEIEKFSETMSSKLKKTENYYNSYIKKFYEENQETNQDTIVNEVIKILKEKLIINRDEEAVNKIPYMLRQLKVFEDLNGPKFT